MTVRRDSGLTIEGGGSVVQWFSGAVVQFSSCSVWFWFRHVYRPASLRSCWVPWVPTGPGFDRSPVGRSAVSTAQVDWTGLHCWSLRGALKLDRVFGVDQTEPLWTGSGPDGAFSCFSVQFAAVAVFLFCAWRIRSHPQVFHGFPPSPEKPAPLFRCVCVCFEWFGLRKRESKAFFLQVWFGSASGRWQRKLNQIFSSPVCFFPSSRSALAHPLIS